jgi:hypothetical protein
MMVWNGRLTWLMAGLELEAGAAVLRLMPVPG